MEFTSTLTGDKYTYKNTGKGMVTANIVVHYPN